MVPVLAPQPAPQAQWATLRLTPYPQLISTRFTAKDGLPPGPIAGVHVSNGHLIAFTADGAAAVYEQGKWRKASGKEAIPTPSAIVPRGALPAGAVVTSAARCGDGSVWAVTNQGAFVVRHGHASPLTFPRTYKVHQAMPNVDGRPTQVVADDAGHVWIATDRGVLATDGADWWHPLTREDGMPYEDVLCVHLAPNGDLWGGTTSGAWRLRAGQWRYFAGRRWLPGDRVTAIATDAAGAVWLATDGGVARIEERMMTLADKAKHYEEITAARHNRRGWVTSCGLKTPGDPSGGFVPEASDNDGLWTAIYVAAESFRYAVTREPEARAAAKKSMEAMLDLVRLSGYPGFPARALIRKGEVVTGYGPNETVRIEGEKDPIWYTSPVDPEVLVKGDTSSDELDGHYFAWLIYYDLVADEAEKKEIARTAAAVTDNILDHNYTLVGHTGRRTRWGAFGPQFMNDDPLWWEERGLNSSELLCYLKVAHYLTGNPRYANAYEELIRKHHYLLNTLNYRRDIPWNALNHSDDELAYCVYYPILLLEKDPAKRSILVQTIAGTWNGGERTAGLREENSPFYSFIYGATTGAPCRTEAAVETLRDWPWELIDWQARNSDRHDVRLRTALGERRIETDRVLPMSERPLMRWNGNPWSPDGGNPASEEDASAWLLPYWMGRYHGLISE